MEHTKHLWRAALIVIIVLVAVVVGRHFLIPQSFGDMGYYRGDSLSEYMDKPVMHGGATDCAPCHKEIFDNKMKGKHATVSCEVCHEPMAVHATKEGKIAEMPKYKSQKLCSNCHQKLRARPDTMPQIEFKDHLVTLGVIAAGEEIPDDACFACHDVHSPSLK